LSPPIPSFQRVGSPFVAASRSRRFAFLERREGSIVLRAIATPVSEWIDRKPLMDFRASSTSSAETARSWDIANAQNVARDE
jgi:hypothetical protein